MDNFYENLENYEDVNKIAEIISENKEMKNKIEGYTSTIAKLQSDFDMLAAEHKKLEQNFSSLLKTARAEIERKTQMINNLNIEKDKLIINARQNMRKDNNRYKRNESNKFKNNKNSDSSVHEQSDGVTSKIHNPKTFCKSDNVSSAPSFNNGKTDPNIASEVGRNNLNKKNVEDSKHCVPKEVPNTQVLNKLDNKDGETRLKKISDRRKSMPVLSSNEIKFSSDEDCGKSIESEISKKNYQNKEEPVKTYIDRNHSGNRMSETSSVENYIRHHETFAENNYKNRTNRNRSRDRYESSYRRREKYSPERSYQRGANNYRDDYYQRYDYSSRRAYENPLCEKPYHNSRSRDHRYNYDRDRSRDYIKKGNDDERYVEKHKLLDEYDEPTNKRQKFEHDYRYPQDYYKDYNNWQKEVREQLTCQSPDHQYPDYFMPTGPIKEIKYTANVPLDDPRLTSKKYKIVSCSNKEFITTVGCKNLDVIPVNKTKWGYVPVPMPKLLLEPPPNFTEDTIKNVNGDNHNPSSYNLLKSLPSNTTSNRSEDSLKNKVLSAESGSLPYMQKSAVDNKILPENSLCNDGGQNRQTRTENNSDAGLRASLGECRNTKTDEAIGAVKDIIVKDNVKENHLTQKINSMPKLNSVSLKEDNNVDKEVIQNMPSVALLGNKIKNTRTEKTIEAPMDKIGKDNGCKNSNIDMVKEIVSTSKESSKSNLIQELNSMPQLNLNPSLSREDKNVTKELMQINDDFKSYEMNKVDTHGLTNLVENDLILSDETIDACDVNPKSNKTVTKGKIKKKKELKSCNKNESDVAAKAEDCANKKKQTTQRDKVTSPQQNNRHKNKKKIKEKEDSDSDQPKAIKLKRSKTEKETKTHEIKSKFTDLFGDSNSLITPDELGIKTNEDEIGIKYDTIFEDTEAAVDLNLKEIELNQKSGIDAQNESVNEKIFVETNLPVTVTDCGAIKDNNEESNKKVINDNEHKEAEFSTVKDTLSLPNIHGNINLGSPDVVKTVIISTGKQPQNIVEDHEDSTQPKNMRSTEKPLKSVALHALATSTPAKPHTDGTASEHVFSQAQDCSSNGSSTNNKVLSTPIDQPSGTHIDSQTGEYEPDVRIFVKRRRKVKK